MLSSVKLAIRGAKIAGLKEMLTGQRFAKRSLAALAAGIGDSERDTAELLRAEFGPDAVESIGRHTGKVYFNFVNHG